MRILDGDPGAECQIDFGQMGFIDDVVSGRRRKVHALIFTAVLSRHMFVHLTYSQTLTEVIAGCQAAWEFFGGVFEVLIPDNLKPVVIDADPVNPRLSTGWLDYSQHVGFATDPARVRSPQDKPRVERTVQYVRNNFFAGENFQDLDQAQAAAKVWCARTAGMRIHGSTAARPLETFNELERSVMLPVPRRYDVPILRSVKVHRDFHIEIGKALYSVARGLHRPDIGGPGGFGAGEAVLPGSAGQGSPEATCRRPVDRPGGSARRAGRVCDAGSGPPAGYGISSRRQHRDLRGPTAG